LIESEDDEDMEATKMEEILVHGCIVVVFKTVTFPTMTPGTLGEWSLFR